ncbi:transmembrane protein 79-like [Saccoglossus kowalevskii]|uniref:Transmembrane protein 79-like n=1 Tax=Saccoglossus kowalevskii TaxID=10224 RepID=A0ABM0M0G5_SACKO|nr:PREDICTED: transmembrane protein 79-like [Saccoglossus kowalevskii]
MAFTPDQWRVCKHSVASFVFQLVVYTAAYCLPLPTPVLPTVFDRLIFTLRWLTLDVFTLFMIIIVVANTRFSTSQINPLSKKDIQYVEIHSRCLQNTLEQLTIGAFGKLALCTFLGNEGMRYVPVMTFLFVLGRITFWIGYLNQPIKRAFGFATNTGVNLVIYVSLAYHLVVYGPMYGLASW